MTVNIIELILLAISIFIPITLSGNKMKHTKSIYSSTDFIIPSIYYEFTKSKRFFSYFIIFGIGINISFDFIAKYLSSDLYDFFKLHNRIAMGIYMGILLLLLFLKKNKKLLRWLGKWDFEFSIIISGILTILILTYASYSIPELYINPIALLFTFGDCLIISSVFFAFSMAYYRSAYEKKVSCINIKMNDNHIFSDVQNIDIISDFLTFTIQTDDVFKKYSVNKSDIKHIERVL